MAYVTVENQKQLEIMDTGIVKLIITIPSKGKLQNYYK